MKLKHPAVKAERKLMGLRATKPNEYLHIDTPYYVLSTGKKVCITVVMDNYSKMFLSLGLGESLSIEVAKGALQNTLVLIGTHPDQSGSVLVTDGRTKKP